MCQSLYARQSASAASLSSSWPKSRPAKPGSDGKLSEPSRPLADMSSTRSLHVVGALAQLVEAGRVHAVFLGRPAGDRVEPDVRDVEVEELPHVGAVGAVLDPRRDVLVLRRQVVLEHVGRLDDVVVDADQDEIFEAHAAQHTRADMRADTGVRYVPARWRRVGAVKRRVCVVGVGLSDGPVTPDMSGDHARGAVVPARARRRRARDVRHRGPGERRATAACTR